VSAAPREEACRNCGRPYPAAELDRAGWCERCRRVVVRRASILARIAAAVAAVGILAVVLLVVQPVRFVMVWLVLAGVLTFVVYKLAQRVAFEIIRSRGVPPPPPEE